jgi:hypothetical protein
LKIPEGEAGIFNLLFSLRYLQTLLLPLVSSNSSSPSGIFKLFFSLRYLQTPLLPLVSSNSSSPSCIFKLFFSLLYLQTPQREKKSLKIPKGEEEFEDTRGRRRV